jgi:methylase of polypeptide subunit release factors
MLPGDSVDLRKQRGAFFTPYPIAQYLAEWALGGPGDEKSILDPTSGEGVFLLAAAEATRSFTSPTATTQLYGVDIHQSSIQEADALLSEAGSSTHHLFEGDFFDELPPSQLGGRIPYVDAVVGNPPFVRYQEHRGEVRRKAAAAALAQGVRVSGLASSWAPLLVHAASFLKPDGRLAMVVPTELLSVGYAEPIREWLRRRFKSVRLVLFNGLQFTDAEEQVVLLVAEGTGSCKGFTLYEVNDAADLPSIRPFDAATFIPRSDVKWTDLLVPDSVRHTLDQVRDIGFDRLGSYGRVELGTVTGANQYFMLSEATRLTYDLLPGVHVVPTVPPGSRHVPGIEFTRAQWEQLRMNGERVWMFSPVSKKPTSKGFLRYKALGESLGIPSGYKCSIRGELWWRPPAQSAPDMFFTYMNHLAPRIIRNTAKATFVNSMHGVRLREDLCDGVTLDALPLLAMNTITALSAELSGRAYGGGILKLEPREATSMLVPGPDALAAAWELIRSDRHALEEMVRTKRRQIVVDRVDAALLRNTLDVSESDIQGAKIELRRQQARRQRREQQSGTEEG